MTRGVKGTGPYSRSGGSKASAGAVDTATTTTNIGSKRLGWLVWWTIHQSITFDLTALKTTAAANGLPQWVLDRIVGRQPESAWTVATQLGAKGKPSSMHKQDPAESRSRYLSRDIEEDIRAIVRETTDRNGVKVSAEQVALLTRKAGRVEHEWTGTPNPQISAEVHDLVVDMNAKVADLVDHMDDTRVRSILLDWLNKQYRICLRGTGGVYFIPRPADPAKAATLEAEIAAMRQWVLADPIRGTFSYAEISDGQTTTVQDFVDSAVDDLTKEITEVNERLDGYVRTSSMNAGSMMFSSGEMVRRMAQVHDKLTALQDALGDKVGVVEEMLRLTERRARVLAEESAKQVAAEKAARAVVVKPAKIAGQPQQPASAPNGKKALTGTAKERAAQQQIA